MVSNTPPVLLMNRQTSAPQGHAKRSMRGNHGNGFKFTCELS